MKTILTTLILLSFIACKKSDKKPSINQATIKSYAIQVQSSVSGSVYINGVLQPNNLSTTVKTGDTLKIDNNGSDMQDTSYPYLIHQGPTSLKVSIDNVVDYNSNCNCDQHYTKVFQ